MKIRFFLFLFLISALTSFATHNRAGEISYKHLSGLTFQFTITTYTYTPSPADRPQIDVFWGDGSSSTINRNSKIDLGNDISKNIYITNHSYSSMGSYHITFEDPNRNAGVINIPNSVNIPFFIDVFLIINPFLGNNSSPILLNPPIDNGCVNVPYYHNPGAYDVDGDSLSYKLIACRGYDGDNIPGYTFPSASNSIIIDPITGELTWDSPQLVGEYNIAIQINEYRNGILIGTMVRDMQVSIAACDNQPPEIFTIIDTCVTAGQPLNIDVLVTDPNSSQVTLTATGAPLLLTNSPAFIQSASGPPPITSQLVWNTNCTHVKKNKYSITLKATDNGPIINLVSFKTIYITIVAPKPENLTATPQGNTITLNWNRETCSNAIGYKIFKRTNSQFFEPDICETGLPQYAGYQQIGITNSISDTTFIDDGSVVPIYHGNEYCYRVFAFFADGAESYVSEEACAYITNDAPLITNVDVLETSLTSGKINVKWLAPPEIDTNLVLPPYFYKLYRSSSASSNYVEMATFTFEQDYSFEDINLNTEEQIYYYKIEFWGQGEFVPIIAETSDPASSIYLKITPTDNALKLNWSLKVPWQNVAYDIFKYNSTLDQFDSIGTTTAQNFTDVNLLNGVEYCYIVRSVGGYFTPNTLFPFYNHSQRVCNTPIDNLPPDLPEVNITTDCEEVRITWGYDNDTSYLDVFKYYFFYRPNYQSDYYIIDSLLGFGEPCYPYLCELVLENRPHITGCYRMAMIDSVGNLSQMTPEVCFDVEDCFTYTLPNVFTPNHDGFNDLWTPFPYTNVEVIDLIVYNRWGRKVFQTTDPDINWDGKDYLSNEPVSDGTFYYSCEIILQTLNGPKKKPLHGTVIIIREKK